MIRSIDILEAGHTHQFEALANPISGELRKVRFPTTVVLLEHANEGPILFDTGLTPRIPHLLRKFPDHLFAHLLPMQIDYETTAAHQLRSRGLRPEEIRHVVISHFHSDHVAGVLDFPRARLTYSTEEFRHLSGLSRMGRLRHSFIPELLPQDLIHRRFEPGRDTPLPALGPGFSGRDLFQDGSLYLVSLPGHSLGHQGLFVPDYRGRSWFFVGDAAHLSSSIRDGTAPAAPGPRLIFHDPDQYRETLLRLTPLLDAHEVIPCHCNAAFQRAQSQLSRP